MDNETLSNHYRLSHECGELTRWLCDNRNAFEINLDRKELPSFLKSYSYVISPWPVLISKKLLGQLEELVEKFPSLMSRCITEYYKEDLQGFCRHYGVHEVAWHLLREFDGGAQDQLMRYDLVYSEKGLRILEVNVGSNIGGWQTSWLWNQTEENIRKYSGAADWAISYTNPVESFLRHIHKATHAHVGAKAVGNVLLLLDDFYLRHGLHEQIGELYRSLIAESGLPGKLIFACSLDNLTFTPSGRLLLGEEPVDCVLVTASAKQFTEELTRAHLRHQVFYPDNAVYALLGDKTNFPVMHAMLEASRGKLSDDDARMVEQWVPWSASIADRPVVWKGGRGLPRDIALAHKDELVIKRGLSFQGRDVFVGRFQSSSEWERVLDEAGTNGKWLLQEYCRSDSLFALDVEVDMVAEHTAVWGVFGFGRRYGGSWGRIMKVADGDGVINSARGAKEFLMLEV